MKKITIFTIMLLTAVMSFAQYKLTDMTDATFAAGGDSQWSFEKYTYSTGVYSKFIHYGDSSTCNYVDIYQPERVGGIRITGIDGVTSSGEYTWANPRRMAWFDNAFTNPARTDCNKKFCYISRLAELGNAFEAIANDEYTSVISFTVPADGYYKVSGSVIRQDGNAMKAIYVIPRYRYATAADINYVNSASTMGMKFAFGAGGSMTETTAFRLADGGEQRYTAQSASDFGLTFQGKKGDVISFEVNILNLPTSTWSRDYYSRSFYKNLTIESVAQAVAAADTNYVNPYDTKSVETLMDKVNDYLDQENGLEIGNNYGQYPQAAINKFESVANEITTTNTNGGLNAMNAIVYTQQIDAAWTALMNAKIVIDYSAEGNYILFSTDSTLKKASVADNNDSPWGYYYYTVSSGVYTKFPNYGTTKANTTGWYNNASDWMYILPDGNMHPLTTASPTIMFTAPQDGVYRVGLSCYRPSPNSKVENPLYMRCRFVNQSTKDGVTTLSCSSSVEMFSKQYGSVANDGKGGKAPIDMDFYVNMKKGDKITAEEDAYTSNRNSSAATLFTRLYACSKVNADSVITLASAKVSGLDVYDPYSAGDVTALKATVHYADSVITAIGSNVGSGEGQYPTEYYDNLKSLVNQGNDYISIAGDPSVTQPVIDELVSKIKAATASLIAARIPYTVAVSGVKAIRIAGTQNYIVQKNKASGTDNHHYAAIMNFAGIVADTVKNSTRLSQYEWSWTFTANTNGGYNLTDSIGHLTKDGYVVEGADTLTLDDNRLTFYTREAGDSLIAIKRADGNYWKAAYSWSSPYDKVQTQTAPAYLFILCNAHSLMPTSVKGITEQSDEVSRVIYYNLSGSAMSAPSRGVVIKKTFYKDGTSKVQKYIAR